MRLNKEEIQRRETMVKEFFKANPYAGIQLAQGHLQKKGERTMNAKALTRIRELVRRELAKESKAQAASGASPPPAGLAAQLTGPMVATLKTLAELMKGSHIHTLSVDLASGRPLVKFEALTPVSEQVDIAAEGAH